MNLRHYGRKWSLDIFRRGNGSKQLGCDIWWNDARMGLEAHFLVWDLMIMREWDQPTLADRIFRLMSRREAAAISKAMHDPDQPTRKLPSRGCQPSDCCGDPGAHKDCG